MSNFNSDKTKNTACTNIRGSVENQAVEQRDLPTPKEWREGYKGRLRTRAESHYVLISLY